MKWYPQCIFRTVCSKGKENVYRQSNVKINMISVAKVHSGLVLHSITKNLVRLAVPLHVHSITFS